MRRIENHCCQCAVPAYPCRGNACELRHVEVAYCDECGGQLDGYIYDDGSQELCEECLLEKYRKKEY